MSMKTLRLALAGVTHDHVSILDALSPEDFEIVAAQDGNAAARAEAGARFRLPPERLFDNVETMLDTVKPDAVAAFGSIGAHRAVVLAAAARGIHAMVEKPLAIDAAEATEMAEAVRRAGIYLMVNYETTWYPSVAFAFDFVKSGQIGAVRKIVVRDGHGGPVESGCQPRFLDWLLDPAESGGGALVDFGCYGINLVSALLDGRRPLSITAAVRRFKPDIYERVEDDATILLDYGDFDAVIQPSWCWPFPRKDMEIHGDAGYILAPDADTVRFRRAGEERETVLRVPALPPGHHEPFAFLAGLVRGERSLAPYDLSGLDNNLIVSAVLDLAKASARQARTLALDE